MPVIECLSCAQEPITLYLFARKKKCLKSILAIFINIAASDFSHNKSSQ